MDTDSGARTAYAALVTEEANIAWGASAACYVQRLVKARDAFAAWDALIAVSASEAYYHRGVAGTDCILPSAPTT